MRIDKLLNKLCIVKTRTKAKKACDQKLVKINDNTVKASSKVEINDKIQFNLYGKINIIEITDIPKGNVSKKNAADYYKLISTENI